jgi:hypothetical protein
MCRLFLLVLVYFSYFDLNGAQSQGIEQKLKDVFASFDQKNTECSEFVRVWAILPTLMELDATSLFRTLAVPAAATLPVQISPAAKDLCSSHGKTQRSSTLLLVDDSLFANFPLYTVAKRIEQRLTTSIPGTESCDSFLGSDAKQQEQFIQCCTSSPTQECLSSWPIDRSDPFARLNALNLVVTLADLLAIEFLGNDADGQPRSFIITLDQLRAGKLPGDKVYYVWPYLPSGGANTFLFSEIDADILERLVATLDPLIAVLSQAYGISQTNCCGFSCAGNKFTPAVSVEPTPFRVSTSRPSKRRSPFPATISMIDFVFRREYMQIHYSANFVPPSTRWATLSDQGLSTGSFLSCFGAKGASKLETMKKDPVQYPMDAEVIAFFAYTLYLNSLWTALGSNDYQ